MQIKIYQKHIKDIPSIEGTSFFHQLTGKSFFCKLSENLNILSQIYQEKGNDYIGYMQPKRLLSLKGNKREKALTYEDHAISEISKTIKKRYGWDDASIKNICHHADIIIPHSYKISELSEEYPNRKTVIDFYLNEGGEQEDIDFIIKQIRQDDPAYFQTCFQVLYGSDFIPWLLFLMKADLFKNYCNFVFPILEKLYATTKDKERESFQKNFWDFTAEILFNIWLKQKMKEDPTLKILYGSIIWLDDFDYTINRKSLIEKIENDTMPMQTPKEVHYGGQINIVLSFDDHYAKHACATINSVLAHTANAKNITFYIFADERLTPKIRERFQDIYNNKVKIIFCDIKEDFVHEFTIGNPKLTINTYYRLLAHKILPENIKRFIWLDTDMIICQDIVDLWNSDLHGKSLAAVQEENGLISERLLFQTNHYQTYINAGLLLWDIAQSEKKYGDLDILFIESFYCHHITKEDQDILNLAFHDDIKLLPLKWNLATERYCSKDHHAYGDVDGKRNFFLEEEKKEEKLNPAILHFTGGAKPWKFSCRHPLRQLYWYYYKQNPLLKLSLIERLKSWNNFLAMTSAGIFIYIRGKDYFYPFSFKKIIQKIKGKI